MQSPAFSLVSLSSLIVLLLGVSLYTQEKGPSQLFLALSPRAGLRASNQETLYDVIPHTASWNTWFHPHQKAIPQTDPPKERRKGWNLLYHLGGYGPWIENVNGTTPALSQDTVAPPVGCLVDQIHMVRSNWRLLHQNLACCLALLYTYHML